MNKFEEFQNTQLDSFLTHDMQLKQAFEFGFKSAFKSIVKTVDPDNLPDGIVYTAKDGFIFSGRIDINDTHYIEQKDLIKLITGK